MFLNKAIIIKLSGVDFVIDENRALLPVSSRFCLPAIRQHKWSVYAPYDR
jgi:hypothetical protein